MWDHRNKFLHDRNKSFHPNEIEDIIKEITYEWSKGMATLSSTYQFLFSGNLKHTILDKSHTGKLNWLVIVWTIRELQDPIYFLQPNHLDTVSIPRGQYIIRKGNIFILG